MSVELFNCPSCGMPLDINVNDEFVQCKYCNNTICIQKEMLILMAVQLWLINQLEW